MEWFAKVRNDLSDLRIVDSNGMAWSQNELGVAPIVNWDDGKVTVMKLVTFDSIDLEFQNYEKGQA